MTLKPFIAVTMFMLIPVMSMTIQAAEQKAHELTAKLRLTSNYLWRGVTQTNDQAAVQGVIKYRARNGIILATGVSNVDFGAPQGKGYEQDWYIGYGNQAESVT